VLQSKLVKVPDPFRNQKAIPASESIFRDSRSNDNSSASEYVRELIRADEKRKAEERLEALLLEGLQSTETELTQADWSEIRQQAIAQVKARRQTR
jgi:antitoxin ParD1/3/4